jgi:two-component system sensor histidine kinase SenX3
MSARPRAARAPVLGLALGGLALLSVLAGALGLGRVFLDEHADAGRAIEAERRAVSRAARARLERRLERALADAEARAEAALAQPLLDDGGLLRVIDGRWIRPRPLPDPRLDGRVHGLLAALSDGVPETTAAVEPSPWTERLERLRAVEQAVAADDALGLERAVRRFLEHRLAHVLTAAEDLVTQLRMVEALARHPRADPQLVRRLLREGVDDGRGHQLPGLPAELLARRAELGPDDVDALVIRLRRAADAAGVPSRDLAARAAERRPSPRLPEPGHHGLWILEGAWIVRGDRDEAIGVAVDPSEALAAVERELGEDGLLGEGDRLLAGLSDGDAVPLEDLSVELRAPRLDALRAAADRRLGLKLGLLGASLGLALGLAALTLAFVRRGARLAGLRNDFVAAVSHELRTPLAAVRVMAETLDRRLGEEPRAKGYPARIVREIDGLTALVDNLLSFRRLEEGRWTPETEPVALDAALRRSAEAVETRAPRPLELDVEGVRGVVVDADPELLALLLGNLLHNATKYTERARARVVARAFSERDAWRIELEDDGIGIDPEDRERLLEPFERASGAAVRREKGSGLGLAIARRVMRAHRGELSIARSGPAGTVFALHLPRKPG